MIILVAGLPGSGKSYFASRLADETGYELLSSDKIRKQRMASGKYSYNDKLSIYAAMAELAEIILRRNQPVIVDATFSHDQMRKIFYELAGKFKVPCKFILVYADEETIKARLSKSRVDSEADYAVHRLLKAQYEPIHEDHLELASEDFRLMNEKVRTYLIQHE